MLQPILIAALSGRALAQSARRARYAPLVVDAFGDEDTLAAAAQSERVSSAARRGFGKTRLLSVLGGLARRTPVEPLGLVLGAGLETEIALLSELAKRFRLIGCTPDVVRNVKEPAVFFTALDRLGVPHPETRAEPPEDRGGWLRKLVGGNGGAHIVTAASRGFKRNEVYSFRSDSPGAFHKRFYYQRHVSGRTLSLLAVAAPGGLHAVGFSRQWTCPASRRPFRYGGAVSVVGPPTHAAAMLSAAEAVSGEFALRGLVSFDFIVAEGTPLLLEVNPRPGATLDIFDDADGTLFEAHVDACLNSHSESTHIAPPTTSFPRRREPTSRFRKGALAILTASVGSGDPLSEGAARLASSPALNGVVGSRLRGNDGVFVAGAANTKGKARATAYLYADRGPLRFPRIEWPDWAADRPRAGSRIPKGHPIATAFADGVTPDEAEALCRNRLRVLEDMIYGRA